MFAKTSWRWRACALISLFMPIGERTGRAMAAAAGDSQSLGTFARAQQLCTPIPVGDTVSFGNRYVRFVGTAGSRQLRCGDVLVWMNEPLMRQSGEWLAHQIDLTETIGPLAHPYLQPRPRRNRVVVLDPGHGGEDAGTRPRTGRQVEAELNLDVAKKVRDQLRNSGLQVVMTRERNHTVSLPHRSILAQSAGADVFVSIHANSAANPHARGIETFVLTPVGHPSSTGTIPLSGPASDGHRHRIHNLMLGYYLQKGAIATTRAPDRGVKRERYAVLRNAPCPAALIEYGFLSNWPDATQLAAEPYRDRVAAGIAQGILTYTHVTDYAAP